MAEFFWAGHKEGSFRAEHSAFSEEEGKGILDRVKGIGEAMSFHEAILSRPGKRRYR